MPDNSNYQFGAIPGGLVDYVKDKAKSSKSYFRYLLARTTKMFSYKGLPDTIPEHILERYLQINGICCITEYNGSLYAFNGSLGGEQDVYYRPTIFVISNPHLAKQFSKEVLVTDQLVNLPNSISSQAQQKGVLMRNDTEWAGLTPLIARYASLMAENVLTVRSADIMLRILALLSAPNDKTRKSAEIYLAKLERGELGIISDSAFTEGIRMQSPPSNNGSYLTQFIELQQYFKGSFFNELGLRANYNMKRESISEGESSLNDDAILPLCDNMLQCRKEDVSRLNDMYGTSITVDFSSAWLRNNIEYSISMISQLKEIGDNSMGDGDGQMGSGEVNSGSELGAESNNEKEGEEDAEDRNGDSSEGRAEETSGDGQEDKEAGEGERESEAGPGGNEDESDRRSDDEAGSEDGNDGDDRAGTGEEEDSEVNDVTQPDFGGDVVEIVNEAVMKKLEEIANE